VHVELRKTAPAAPASAHRLALALAIATAACTGELPPAGEVLIIVDTDLPVPAAAARLRVDLYSEDGSWYESRNIALRNPSDWPASFGLVARDGAERRVLVRLRVYPEGKVRDYRGERFAPRDPYQPPAVAASMSELCAAPPVLPIGGTVTLRRGSDPFIGELSGGDCVGYYTTVGSSAAAIDIVQPGSYRFGVLDASQQFTLQLRRDCHDASTALACNEAIESLENIQKPVYHPAELKLELDAGRYYLVTGGSTFYEAPADVVLGAAESAAWPPPYPPAQTTVPENPQLMGSDADIRLTEPQPLATVDRLVLVRIVPDRLRSTRVTLRGACLGTMAQLGPDPPYQTPALDDASTCVATAGTREPVREAPLDISTDAGVSAQGTFPAPEPCEPGVAGAERICVPGGFFLLGSPETVVGNDGDSIPERAAVMRRFWIDRYELTVARYRDALNKGFNPGTTGPVANEGQMGQTAEDTAHASLCTWSKSNRRREDMAVTCIDWYGARAVCRFLGGDLPTEAQWEYVATAAARGTAGRAYETRWPWGGDAPACLGDPRATHHAVFGRTDVALLDTAACYLGSSATFGPLKVTASEGPNGDETMPLDGTNGVVGLVGGVSEWVRDAFRPFGHPCWDAASVVDPECVEHEAPRRAKRGGNWLAYSVDIWVTQRWARPPLFPDPQTGFRCVYPGPNAP
jgi:formylglycine-generating enzyme required for sulfatase activity